MGCFASRALGAGFGQQVNEHETAESVITATLGGAKAAEVSGQPHPDVKHTHHLFCPSMCGEFASALRDALPAELLAGAHSPGAQLRALGDALTRDPQLAVQLPTAFLPAVRTPTDTFITNSVGEVLQELVSKPGFLGRANGHSSVLVGPRGSGKTYALRRLALTASVLYPELRVVYVSAKGITSVPWHPLRAGLCEMLLGLGLGAVAPVPADAGGFHNAAAVAAADGVPPVPPAAVAGAGVQAVATDPAPAAASVDALIQHLGNLRLLILVDEMEALYTTTADFAYQTLGQIEALADSPAGRTAVVGCSSSSLLYPLIRGGNPLHISLRKALFPMADPELDATRRLSDMNGQKLALQELPAARCTDISVVEGFAVPGTTAEQHRVVAFVMGNNIRRLFVKKVAGFLMAPVPYYSDASSPMETSGREFRVAYPGVISILTRIYDMLAGKNWELLLSALGEDVEPPKLLPRLNVEAIANTDWYSLFKPLTADNIYQIYRQLRGGDGPVEDADVTAIVDYLHHDAALIVVCRDPHERLQYLVYPSSPFTVLLHAQWTRRSRYNTDDFKAAVIEGVTVKVPAWLMEEVAQGENWQKAAKGVAQLMGAMATSASRNVGASRGK